jgi:hypothetical protein
VIITLPDLGRQMLVHRCTTQRRESTTDDYNMPTYPEAEDYLTDEPCLWEANTGRGELSSVDREQIAKQSNLTVEWDSDIVESDIIVDIVDLRGNVISAGPWEIKAITLVPSLRTKVLLLAAP